MAIALEETENDEVLGTAEFCKMMNNFDCTNVRSLTEHEKKEILFSNHTHPKTMKDFPG